MRYLLLIISALCLGVSECPEPEDGDDAPTIPRAVEDTATPAPTAAPGECPAPEVIPLDVILEGWR